MAGGPSPVRRPRLLLLITLAETGGAQSYLAALLPALTDGFDVTLAAHGEGPLREAARAAGVRFVPLNHVRRALNPLHDVLGLIELVRLIGRLRPDILHANSSKAGILGRLAGRLRGVPIRVFTVHGWAFGAHQGIAGRLYLLAERSMRPFTTAIICVAEHERRAGIAAGACRAEQAVVIPNAVDVASFPIAAPGDGDVPTVISVGRFRAPKDFITLARALAHLPSGSFATSLVGDGPERGAIEAEIDRLGLAERVRVLGERPDVPRLLAGADVFVCSSRSEGMPVSILEAMAVGLPVVASAVGGVPELVLDGHTGLLVPPGEVAPLAAALGRVLADRDLRKRMGSAARGVALERFDLPRFRQAHLDLYDRLLSERGLPNRIAR
ncbi:MAG: glycosyltransferase family 4 protein [Solirubrobacteraceae bacterium]